MKKLTALILTFILTLCIAVPVPAEAASAKTRIKKLVANMSSFEYSLISELELSVGEGYEIYLDDEHIAWASALALDLGKAKVYEYDEDGFYTIYSVSSSKIKKMSKKLFGKAVSGKKLSKDKGVGFLYAYRNSKGQPLVYCWEGETETDYDVRSTIITKNVKEYTLVRNLYYGYWGNNDKSTSNYFVTYKVAKNDASSYGYVITSMIIKRIAE